MDTACCMHCIAMQSEKFGKHHDNVKNCCRLRMDRTLSDAPANYGCARATPCFAVLKHRSPFSHSYLNHIMVADNTSQEQQGDVQTLPQDTCNPSASPKAQVSRASSLPKSACSCALLAAGLIIASIMLDS